MEEEKWTEHPQCGLGFNKEQLEQLKAILSGPSSTSIQPTTSVAQKGNYSSALTTKIETSHSWVIDSGASDHMTSHLNQFITYSPCTSPIKIKITDRTLTPVAGIGSIKLSLTLTIHFAFHVPNLSCNLLSISKLTKDCNCVAKFFHTSCEFQDLLSGKTIGSAKENNGIYLFEGDGHVINKQTRALQSEVVSCSESTSVSNKVMLWHNRLGHPSFPYLKQLFPSLFINL